MMNINKFEEFLMLLNDNPNSIDYKNNYKFSDGKNIYNFWIHNKKHILSLINDKKYLKKYPTACKVILGSTNKEINHIKEYIKFVNDNGYIPERKNNIYFSDGTLLSHYWYEKKDKIYEFIQESDYIDNYPLAHTIILKRYNDDMKKIEKSHKRKIKELCVYNYIDVYQNIDIIDSISLEEFVFKLNYLKNNGLNLTLEDGSMNPVFLMDINDLNNNEKVKTYH